MSDYSVKHCIGLLFTACLLLPVAAYGQETGQASSSADSEDAKYNRSVERARKFAQNYRTYERLRKKFDDPAFARYVDFKMLGKAWDRLDSALLTDVALQLAYAEDVLQRQHKKINADTAIDLAFKLAVETKNEVALGRLAKAAEFYGKTELAGRIQNSGKLALASRSIDPALAVPVLDVTAEDYAAYHTALITLTKIRISKDGELLDWLESSPRLDRLPEPQREYVQQQIANLRETVPQKEPVETDNLLAENGAEASLAGTDAQSKEAADQKDKDSSDNDIADTLRTLSAASRAYDAAQRIRRQ